ncbi:MAG: Hdr menaquinol oxidoreductase iron-sulfur subunit 1 [bacterium]|nr:MAG: Hdr menaquinol oxidoreductase iron-sulfur subunit 1 [bacterium]
MKKINRRSFIKVGYGVVFGTAIGPGITLLQTRAEGSSKSASSENRWGMVIDSNRCTEDCTACIDSCRTENNVPLFGDPRFDSHWIRKVKAVPKTGGQTRYLPMLCNHCEHPTCQHVCPVAATFTRKDGIVLIDEHRCIGCRYCMIACPYKARTFIFKKTEKWPNPDVPKRSKGVVEKCNFCVNRIDKGKLPACVKACADKGENAMIFGNLNNPDSGISWYLRQYAPKQLRADLGLEPKVYYRGI